MASVTEENLVRSMEKIIRLALDEDRVDADVTTLAMRAFDRPVQAEVVAKQAGVISGVQVVERTFKMVDPGIRLTVLKGDGDSVAAGDRVMLIEGLESAILRGERTALNFLQRLSGIATTTRAVVDRLDGTGVVLLDTRKTTPGMRLLEKKAVRDGGGRNHRLHLEEMAMVKDNHIRMAGSITAAVAAVRRAFPQQRIEVEVKTLAEFEEAHGLRVDMIMLDNFPPERIAEAVARNRPRVQLEVSGNITPGNIREKAVPGIDFISMGALTHSFASLDLSLEVSGDGGSR